MSNKVALEDRNALAEADALLAEDDGHELQSARRNHDGDDDAFKADLQRLEEEENLPAPVQANQTSAVKPRIHPAPIIAIWIALSSSVIMMNAWILGKKEGDLNFHFPIFLTSTHLIYATIATRIMRRFTHLIDGVDNIQMSWDRWYKNIVPIGALFSASLIFSNFAYLTLSVSFIQMLKAFTSVAVLGMSVLMGLDNWDKRKGLVVGGISAGVALASYGELKFVFSGFVFQCLGILFEATRLVAIQKLLQGMRMDPLVCAVFNSLLIIPVEGFAPLEQVLDKVGPFTLFINCNVALLLNVSVVFLIGCASSLVLTLSGVLKDILLVVGSVVLFGTPVTLIQCIGYGIALVGLFIFKAKPEDMAVWMAQLKALVGR
ncbi:hypothetical protein Rhopal_007500-T1 [Rhodotorula paludigena]|uniref:Sugar phosphate transporter domain-containing protein n=1 Tax=Rhodotorula paludigena TaxID=86838 RepID=A0AAV5GWT1_9BASI|nr:hypothetical protein Rhopal_007500-T1 [Rhodotorula paludigena]